MFVLALKTLCLVPQILSSLLLSSAAASASASASASTSTSTSAVAAAASAARPPGGCLHTRRLRPRRV